MEYKQILEESGKMRQIYMLLHFDFTFLKTGNMFHF